MRTTLRRPYPAYRVNAYQTHVDRVMADMNMTPLIDVLLVLLVMLILAVPLATHQLDVDLPQGGVSIADNPQVSLTLSPQGQVYWDGEAVDRTGLAQRLQLASARDPQPVIRFQPDPQTSYDASVQVIALVGDAGLDNFAFVGNEQFRTFAKD